LARGPETVFIVVIMLPTAAAVLEETTLDEPVMDTLKREFKMIANKMYKVGMQQSLHSYLLNDLDLLHI
jgi:hypothetical protein